MRFDWKTWLAVITLLAPLAQAVPFTLKRFPSVNQTAPLNSSISIVQSQLGPRLSNGASLYFPQNAQYANLTERWSLSTRGDIAVVLVPAVANDVAVTVQFASTHNISFLATSGGHGSAHDLSDIRQGIYIRMDSLNSTSIDDGGNTATLGGGTLVGPVVDFLEKHGKVSSTGSCSCVGMMGAGLGGGFGRYQGFFGLIIDNLIEMDVVLADGSQITVSESSYPDLYWGMRGAGHNFGIVTKFKYKIYDTPAPNWTIATVVYTQDKLEAFFQKLNEFNWGRPKQLTTYSTFVLNPQISATDPVIANYFEFGGDLHDLIPYLQPFLDLKPVVAINVTVPYSGAAHADGAGFGDDLCADFGSRKTFPVGLSQFDIPTERKVWNLLKDLVHDHPEFNTSFVQHESYPLQGVRAVDEASTAYAHRQDNLLVSFGTGYPDPSLDDLATSYGQKATALWHAGDITGRPLSKYVNYASDQTTFEEMYGYEPWRQERLKGLKQKYDPNNRFGFYNPIV